MKYKLIKEYPGSPKLGHVICCNDFTHNGVDRHSCSDYPEFWEEVIEKDYEILSLKKNNNINTVVSFDIDINRLLKYTEIKIHKVKRLSDGEVFTVGDKITGATYNEPRNIISFNISNNKLWIEQDHGSSDLKDIKKLKQPLFTTEDGVDIYDEDEFYWLDKGLNIRNSGYTTIYTNIPNTLYFSTKEKAEEHILMNKPCLSINDVLLSVDGALFLEKTLKEIVKQKLNK